MSESLDECPKNCTTFQQYGDCDHRRPSEIVELKRERDALQRAVNDAARLHEELQRRVEVLEKTLIDISVTSSQAALRGGEKEIL